MTLSETNGIYCHCYPVFRCEPASAEVEGPEMWRPVCERCMQIAFDAGLRVRKLQRGTPPLEAGSWGAQAIDPEYRS